MFLSHIFQKFCNFLDWLPEIKPFWYIKIKNFLILSQNLVSNDMAFLIKKFSEIFEKKLLLDTNNLAFQQNLEVVVEIISILKRFNGMEEMTTVLVESKLFGFLLDLIENYNIILVKHFLEFLIHLIESTRY